MDQVNQLSNSEQTAAGINEDESEIQKALKKFNSMKTPTDNIMERVSNITDKEIKQVVFNKSIPSGVYDLGATSICGQKDDPFFTTG